MCGAPVAIAWADDGRVAVSDRHLGLVMAGGGDPRCHELPRARDVTVIGHRVVAIGGSSVWALGRDVGAPPAREESPVVVDARCAELHGLAPLTSSLVAVAGTAGVAVVDVALGVVDTRVEIDGAFSVAAHPAATFLAVGDLGGSIHVLEMGDEAAGRELTGYPDHVRLLGWGADGAWLVATADDELTCWPAVSSGWPADEPVCCLGHDEPITALAVGAHHDLVASGDASGRLALWSLRVLDAPLHTIDLAGEVTAAEWSGDGTRLAVGTVTGTAVVFDVTRGQLA
jgi:WD40 repeat protein